MTDTIIIIGGTGSLGQAMTEYLLSLSKPPGIRIYSRDEHKQEIMAARFPAPTYILGDIRDLEKLKTACDGATGIIHAAALKRVPPSEKFVDEFIRTNIIGTDNVINAALHCRVPRSLLISSDKACAALNSYGKTKAVAESLFVQASARGVTRDCKFAVVRGGNVWDSRGSVVEKFGVMKRAGLPLTVTDPEATRFMLLMQDWTAFCHRALDEMRGGEVFIPKCRAWRLGDLADAFRMGYSLAGVRDGDKQHERLFSLDESPQVVDAGWAWVLHPPKVLWPAWDYAPWTGSPPVVEYSSNTAERVGVDELRSMIDD